MQGSNAKHVTIERLMSLLRPGVRREVVLAAWAEASDVTTLARRLELDISHVGHAMRPLAEAGLLTRVRRGRRCVYSCGPRASVRREGQSTRLEARADDGSVVAVNLVCGNSRRAIESSQRESNHHAAAPEPSRIRTSSHRPGAG